MLRRRRSFSKSKKRRKKSIEMRILKKITGKK